MEETKTIAEWRQRYPDRILWLHNNEEMTEHFNEEMLSRMYCTPSIPPEREDVTQEKVILFDTIYIPISKLSLEEIIDLAQNSDDAEIVKEIFGPTRRVRRMLKLWWD